MRHLLWRIWTRDAWWRELARRWPLIVGVLRGKAVVFGIRLDPEGLHIDRDAVVFDSTFTDCSLVLHSGNTLTGGTLYFDKMRGRSAVYTRLRG